MQYCTNDLNSQNQDRDSYGFQWSQFNKNYSVPNGYDSIYKAFQYQDTDKLQGSSIEGFYGTYEGSGYVYEMRGRLSYIKGNLSLLQQLQWIDRQTRAVVIEFSSFNPNINLIMVSTILVEFLPSGSIITSAKFDTLNLFSEAGQSFFSFKIVCEIVFFGFIIYYMVMEMRNFWRKDLKRYINELWNYIEWSIIMSAFISMGMLLVRLKTAQDVMEFFKKTGGYGYMNLQKVNEYNQILTFSLGLCSALGTIKLLKMLQFNRNVTLLSATLRRCCGELMTFSLFFFLVWAAFVQLMYFVLNSQLQGYSSLLKAMESAFLIILGKSSAADFIQAYPTLGPIIFACYNMIILCFWLNIFISIITDAFDEIRREAKEKPNDFDALNYVVKRVKTIFWRNSPLNTVSFQDKYKDHLDMLPIYVSRLIQILNRVK